jgi:hypothetical protein
LKQGIIAAILFALATSLASAAPARIIILRHGEKADSWKLCAIGEQRAAALAETYLGRTASQSLFRAGEPPAALVAITLHTLELAAPSALSWPLPIRLYSVVPEPSLSKADFTVQLNRRTQEAVADLMADRGLDGKTVVMVWEHDHIADAKLEAAFPGESVTLRQLLKLDSLADVPDTWPGSTYDYFWIVDFAKGSPTPTGFAMQRQDFGAGFPTVPSNEWGKPNGMTKASGCDL